MSNTLKCKHVVTRKKHVCFGCSIFQPPKSKLLYITQADGSNLHSYYLCAKCEKVWHDLNSDEEFMAGELKEFWEEQ